MADIPGLSVDGQSYKATVSSVPWIAVRSYNGGNGGTSFVSENDR